MDAFAWGVVGSVAGVVGAAATIVFGLVPLLRKRKEPHPESVGSTETGVPSAAGETKIRGRVDADEVDGYVAGVEADRVAHGSTDGTAHVGKVKKGGRVIGVRLGRLDDST